MFFTEEGLSQSQDEMMAAIRQQRCSAGATGIELHGQHSATLLFESKAIAYGALMVCDEKAEYSDCVGTQISLTFTYLQGGCPFSIGKGVFYRTSH